MTGAEFVASLQRCSWCQAFSPVRTVLGIVRACSWEHEKASPILQPGKVINHCVPKAHNGVGGQTEVQRHHCEVSPLQACPFASISCSAGQYVCLLQAKQMRASGWPRLKARHPTTPWPAWCPRLKHLGKCLDHVSSAREKRAISLWVWI